MLSGEAVWPVEEVMYAGEFVVVVLEVCWGGPGVCDGGGCKIEAGSVVGRGL